MDKRIIARWQDWSGEGIEHAVIRRTSTSNSIESAVISGSGISGFAVRYRLDCELSWTLSHAEIELIGTDTKIDLISNGRGKWSDGFGNPLPPLDGAIDIDLSVTPFTNSLPIQRLRLAEGESREILAAYVQFPDLTLSADPQRYTCLEPMRRYRYESLDSDFVREIEVDSDGLIVTYPGLFTRLF
jgi:hypothetical protein